MIRAAVAILIIAAFAGCAAPDDAQTDGATLENPTPFDPFNAIPPASSPTPTGVTPTALPPSPEPIETPTGYTLRVGMVDGSPVFLAADGTQNPTLLVPPDTEITIEFLRGGEVHGFTANGETIIPLGSSDTRGTFTSPASGAFEYGCPAHSHAMRGTVRVA